MTDFLKQILDDPQFKGDRYKNLESLTEIKLYNRLLECYLVKKQRYEAEIEKDLFKRTMLGATSPRFNRKKVTKM